VRASSRTPSRPSSAFIAWLKADGDIPSLEAARVKLAASATSRKAARSLRSFRFIAAFSSQIHAAFKD